MPSLRNLVFAEQLMSMPALRSHRWTADEVDRLVGERPGFTPRYELVDGELLVTPAPAKRHQRIVGELSFSFVRASTQIGSARR